MTSHILFIVKLFLALTKFKLTFLVHKFKVITNTPKCSRLTPSFKFKGFFSSGSRRAEIFFFTLVYSALTEM